MVVALAGRNIFDVVYFRNADLGSTAAALGSCKRVNANAPNLKQAVVEILEAWMVSRRNWKLFDAAETLIIRLGIWM